MGFTVKKRVLRRVLRRGSEKGVSRRCLERPLGEYAPLGVRPKNVVGTYCAIISATMVLQNRRFYGLPRTQQLCARAVTVVSY